MKMENMNWCLMIGLLPIILNAKVKIMCMLTYERGMSENNIIGRRRLRACVFLTEYMKIDDFLNIFRTKSVKLVSDDEIAIN